jgi:hypothetical protein
VNVSRDAEDAFAVAVRSDSPESLGNKIVALLQKEIQAGKDRVSSKSLREELGCDPKSFKAAQAWLGERIIVDGRSLKLNESHRT